MGEGGGVGFSGTCPGENHTGQGGSMPFFLRHRRTADPKGQQENGGEKKGGRPPNLPVSAAPNHCSVTCRGKP